VERVAIRLVIIHQRHVELALLRAIVGRPLAAQCPQELLIPFQAGGQQAQTAHHLIDARVVCRPIVERRHLLAQYLGQEGLRLVIAAPPR